MKLIATTLRPVLYSVVLFWVTIIQTMAQDINPVSKVYAEGELGIGAYEGIGAGLGAKLLLNNKWFLGLSYRGINMTPKNQPSDYQPGEGLAVLIPFTDKATTDVSLLSFTAGKYFSLSRTIWVTAGGGISFVTGDNVTYEPQAQVTTGIFPLVSITSNYRTTKERVSTVGLALEADICWAFASFMGLGIGAHANVNSIQSPAWVDLKLLIGKMGRSKK